MGIPWRLVHRRELREMLGLKPDAPSLPEELEVSYEEACLCNRRSARASDSRPSDELSYSDDHRSVQSDA